MRVRGAGNAIRFLLALAALTALIYGSIVTWNTIQWVNQANEGLQKGQIEFEAYDSQLTSFMSDHSFFKEGQPSSHENGLFFNAHTMTVHTSYWSQTLTYDTFPENPFTNQTLSSYITALKSNIILLPIVAIVISFIGSFSLFILFVSLLALIMSLSARKKRFTYEQAWALSSFTIPAGGALVLFAEITHIDWLSFIGGFIILLYAFLAFKKVPAKTPSSPQ
ncbi:DUF1189 family protein [Bacillaceae bacterium SIJ1]|nr:DUF1189 family protein [Litoribacterium kuwaitense]